MTQYFKEHSIEVFGAVVIAALVALLVAGLFT
jgi:hypothetical protein